MSPDTFAEIEIAAAPADIAAVMFDPSREPEWMSAVRSVEVLDPVIRPGARVKHAGDGATWTTSVAAFHFPHRLVLTVADGPFAGTVSYDIQRSGTGSVARIKSAGLTTKSDLERLKAIVEKSKTNM